MGYFKWDHRTLPNSRKLIELYGEAPQREKPFTYDWSETSQRAERLYKFKHGVKRRDGMSMCQEITIAKFQVQELADFLSKRRDPTLILLLYRHMFDIEDYIHQRNYFLKYICLIGRISWTQCLRIYQCNTVCECWPNGLIDGYHWQLDHATS